MIKEEQINLQKKAAGELAATYVSNGMIVGLGTGSTAYYAIQKLALSVNQGLDIQTVATSIQTANMARDLGLSVVDIDAVDHIDLDIDGVDEIDGQFNAIKGGGGALTREKIVATMADRVIWIMDENKQVAHLGAFPLPVEVVPYGSGQLARHLSAYHPRFRQKGNEHFVTDNGNYILDLHIGTALDVAAITAQLQATVGIVTVGLFINLCERILVGTAHGVTVIENPNWRGRR